ASGAGARGADGARVPAVRVQGVLTVRRVRGGLAVLGVLVIGACAPGPVTVMMPGTATKPRAVTLRVQVREGTNLVVRTVSLEDYVAVTALSEVHPEAGREDLARHVFEV